MRLSKCLRQAFNMVVHSRLRSWLTIIGIVLGVGAVIAIVSLGHGLQTEVQNQFGSLGADLLTVSAGFSRGGGFFGGGGREFGGGGSAKATTKEVVLGRADVQALRGIPEIKYINTQIRGSVDVTYLGKSGTVSLTGVDQNTWADVTTDTVSSGRLLGPADQNVVVIGGRLASSYFDQPLGINKMINIEGSNFRIVGVLDDQSTSIYMPIQMAFQVIPDHEANVYDTIIVKVRDVNNIDKAIADIDKRLMVERHVTNSTRDFSVTSNQQVNNTRQQAMSSMNLFLLAIAAVSLIVGAVGIANTMFTSVLEKTKEIGIMKAIGARNKDILLIFLLNSCLIGLVGGILGIIFGTILSGLIPMFLGSVGFFRAGGVITLSSVVIAISISLGVGILAGFIPAYKASKLRPVDALRYE
jgi:putative ABC transport system permease protein